MIQSAPLLNRLVISLSGKDTEMFLHGLMTNSVKKIPPYTPGVTPLYTAFLNAQGRFLTDGFLVHVTPDDHHQCPFILLDIENTHAHDFLKKLKLYKLRSDVTITVLEAIDVSVCFDMPDRLAHPAWIVRDGRDGEAQTLGYRVYHPKNDPTTNHPDAQGLLALYHQKRIQAFIADGTISIAYQRGFIIEFGFQYMDAIDFQKGCYVGQELTTRMHHQHMAKRELACLEILDETFNSPMQHDQLFIQNHCIGKVLEIQGRFCLCHMFIDARPLILSNNAHHLITVQRQIDGIEQHFTYATHMSLRPMT